MDFYSDCTARDTLSSVIQGTQVFTDLSELVCQLGKIGVNGPRHFSQPNLDARSRLVGRGAQFEVYELTSGMEPDIVVKRVRLDVLPGTTRPDARSHLRILQLEIASLCDPARRSNRNIVDVVTWGYDYPSPDLALRVPVLCVEKAICALGEFLSSRDFQVNHAAVPYQFCLDISAGLQAIHSTGLVHGDLKPANVLVFKQDDDRVPFIAKLSDFGKCIEVNALVKSFASYTGTQGWRPPECEVDSAACSDDFRPSLLYKCDSYAYGLLAISVLMFRGAVVQDQQLIGTDSFLTKFQSYLTQLPNCASGCIGKITSLYLQHHPGCRSEVSPDMIECKGEDFRNWQEARKRSSLDSGEMLGYKTATDYRYYRTMDPTLLVQLEAQLSDQTKTLEDFGNELVFGMAIRVLERMDARDREQAVLYFEAAAKQSNVAARAIFNRIKAAAQSNGISVISDVETKQWLFEGASTGSLIAMEDLNLEHPELGRKARHRFVELGGFNKDVSSSISSRVSRLIEEPSFANHLNKAIDDYGNRPLHYAASYGLESLIKTFVENGAFTDERNSCGETALYKACQAGNATTVKTLVNLGADASLVSSAFGVSCLHWLFNFEASDIRNVAQLLSSRGAKVDALTHPSTGNQRVKHIPADHFPFHWPQGAPIHWAAFAGSSAAVDALIDIGASVDIWSAVEPNHAQTALALASRHWNSTMVKHLLSRGADPTLQDSLHCTPVHAMVRQYGIKDEMTGWSRALRSWVCHGSWHNHVEELRKCAVALADAGCDLNAWIPLPDSDTYFTNPIADAAESRFAGAVLGLLKAGAAPDRVRPYEKDTPLHMWVSVRDGSLPYVEAYTDVWEALLERASGLDIRDVYGKSLWHRAISAASVDQFHYIAKFLVHAQPPLSLEITDVDEQTPLLCAAGFKGHVSLQPEAVLRTTWLLDLGADITARDYDNRDFIFLLCMNGALSDSDCLQLIHRALRDMPADQQRDLVQRSISHKAGQTSLMWACHNSFLQVVKFLVALGVDVNADSKAQGTALDFALYSSEQTRQKHLFRWVFDGKLLFDGQTLRFTELEPHADALNGPASLLADANAVTKLFQRTITEADVGSKLYEDGHADARKYFDCIEVVKVLLSTGARSTVASTLNLDGTNPYDPRVFDRDFVEELRLESDAAELSAEMQPFYEEHWKLLYTLRL